MIERRLVQRGAEVRATNGGHITGHAAVFNQEYVLWDDDTSRVVEMVKPGTFSRAIKENQDVRGLFNHEPNNLLGRTKAGTLSLKEDSTGLYFDIEPPDTQNARDVYALVKRGDITGCSFAFTCTKENVTQTKKGGKIIHKREIQDVDLYDVGPVTFPAYDGTDVNARSMELRSTMFPEGMPAIVRRLIPPFGPNANAEIERSLMDVDVRMRLAGLRSIS